MNYKTIIDNNIKNIIEGEFVSSADSKWSDDNIEGYKTAQKEFIKWHKQSLITYLEEENNRLKGKYAEGTDDRPTTYNKAIREQIYYNLKVITYLK